MTKLTYIAVALTTIVLPFNLYCILTQDLTTANIINIVCSTLSTLAMDNGVYTARQQIKLNEQTDALLVAEMLSRGKKND